MTARGPFVSASTAAGRVRIRTAWVELLELAAQHGEAAARGVAPGRLEIQAFSGQLIRTTAYPFPLPYVSARATAEGFHHLARGFVDVARPDLREALGAALAAAARCCQRMIQLDTDEQAAAWRRRHPED